MNWRKVIEQTVTVVLSMVLTATGTAVGWGIVTVMQHDRELSRKDAELQILKHEMEMARERDKELIAMMAEELKKLQDHIQEMKDQEPLAAEPKKDPKKPKWSEQDYQHILRDKFEQRTEQMQLEQRRK